MNQETGGTWRPLIAVIFCESTRDLHDAPPQACFERLPAAPPSQHRMMGRVSKMTDGTLEGCLRGLSASDTDKEKPHLDRDVHFS